MANIIYGDAPYWDVYPTQGGSTFSVPPSSWTKLPVTMRTTPTATLYSISGAAGKVRQLDGTGAPTDISASPNASQYGIAFVTGGFVPGTHYGFSYIASAEL